MKTPLANLSTPVTASAYEIPTNPLIVSSGSSYVWRKAGDLAGSDLVLVCTIPVEPGAYSSCRDAAGIRRTAFVPKDSVITGGRNSVIVSKTGGDYTDPVTAAENAFAGDTWCVAPQWPDQPCVMAIGEGIFILRKTLSIPEGLAVSGNGKGDTMLVADNGVETAVSSLGNVRFTDLTIVNSQPGGARTTGLKIERSRTAGTLDPASRCGDPRLWCGAERGARQGRLGRDPGFRDHRCGAGHDRYL